ncbi:MAG: sodium-dependent transporter [Ruminococcaceae bacterium]|nr:sodium-dependent transporter [Oscillospiraceae bacterium]
MQNTRSSFTGKIGFVLAAAGSAVGLGNIWRFPYLANNYGGGLFLLIYVLLSVTFGFTLMIAEIAIGRKTGLSPLGAFKKLNKRFAFVGYLATIIPMLILPYYSVIGGWVMKYSVGFAIGHDKQMAIGDYFSDYISAKGAHNFIEPIGWFLLFVGLTAVIVMLGVQKGIEKVSKVMMPVLVLLIIFIAAYSIVTMDGAAQGVKYYLLPNFKGLTPTKLLMTIVAAMGQLFYSMSLAMGIMITFGSYMKKDVSIEKSTHQIEFFDTGIAFLAGLMIVPAVFVFNGGDPEKMNKGAGLMFDTLPKVFDTMPGGRWIGLIFFVMVFFAALTSSISLMETIVAVIQDKFKMGRKTACAIVLAISLALGLPSALGSSIWSQITILGKDFLGFFDFVSNSVLMPITAFATCILVAFVLKPKSVIEEVQLNGKFKQKGMFSFVIRYVAPVFIIAILVSSVLEALGVIEF